MATIKEQFEIHTSDINEATRLLLEELNDREGQYVWKQLTAEGGDFISYVVADNENSYPDGAMLDGYWYEVVVNDSALFEYEYSGSSNGGYEIIEDPNGGVYVGWTLKLLTSGILNIKQNTLDTVDVFLVGGGGGGGGAIAGGGGGGGGGYTVTQNALTFSLNQDYEIVIGGGGSAGATYANGGRGGTTTAFGLSAEGGYGGSFTERYNVGGDGGAGGSGGGGGGVYKSPSSSTAKSGGVGGKGQDTTTRAFGEASGTQYAGGGGGGGDAWNASSSNNGGSGGNGGSNGGSGKTGNVGNGSHAGGSAGSGGGGKGGTYTANSGLGYDGTANTGGGGGGGSSDSYNNKDSKGGAGGSGIVILRGRRA